MGADQPSYGCGMVWPGPAVPQVPIITKGGAPAEDIDARIKRELDNLARSIGRDAVNHLKEMYPAAMTAVTKNAEISLTNHVRNQINHHMKPVLALLIELKKNGTI